jgi:hypothetical protein
MPRGDIDDEPTLRTAIALILSCSCVLLIPWIHKFLKVHKPEYASYPAGGMLAVDDTFIIIMLILMVFFASVGTVVILEEKARQ